MNVAGGAAAACENKLKRLRYDLSYHLIKKDEWNVKEIVWQRKGENE